jgi:plastocyanin
MERRKRMRSRLGLCTAIAVTGALFYSMLTWLPASAADRAVNAKLANGFDPDPITVAPGDTLTWTNLDTALVGDHDIVADGTLPVQKAFEGNCRIAPGESCSKEVTSVPVPMDYEYHCSIHPEMTGTISVDPDAEPPEESTSPSGSASASGSPSPSSTPSGSPSGSPSTSPSSSPSSSPSASPSPSPSESPGPIETERTVSLNLEDHLRAKGRVKAEEDPSGACVEDVKVTIQKKKQRRKGWKKIDTARTDADGKYSVKIPDKQGRYRAKIEMETRGLDLLTCSAATSDPDRHEHGKNDRR